jgi:hypothetical protein
MYDPSERAAGCGGIAVPLNEPLITRIGKLESGEYYLRFVNDPLIDSDIWLWWGVLSAVPCPGLVHMGLEGAQMRSSLRFWRGLHHLYPGFPDPSAFFSGRVCCPFFLYWKPFPSGSSCDP